MEVIPSPPATNIDEVLSNLDSILQETRAMTSAQGYFPALYRRVTQEVRTGITAGRFQDGERMERLDVAFANFYFEAYARHRRGEAPSRSWALCFAAANDPGLIVLQHLLLGINAHINLDLGVAAARTSPGTSLADLRADFLEINAILAEMALEVKSRLYRIWPWLALLDLLAGKADDRIVNFSLGKARDHAWRVAQSLASRREAEQPTIVELADRWSAAFGGLIRNPGPWLGLAVRMVRVGERRSVPEVIDILA